MHLILFGRRTPFTLLWVLTVAIMYHAMRGVATRVRQKSSFHVVRPLITLLVKKEAKFSLEGECSDVYI